jgi:hypothetical protein
MPLKPPLNKNKLIVVYKLLTDLFFVMLFFLMATLFIEAIVPGIISEHIGFVKIIIFIFLNLTALYALGKFLSVNPGEQKMNKKTLVLFFILGIFIIFSNFLRINFILALAILITSLVTAYFVYLNIFEKND